MLAIVLAGGFGTRLRSLINDVPKPMAPILSKPFLAYLLQYLHKQGITQVVFSTHYLAEKIQAYFKSHFDGIDIFYVQEDLPLGTGGAIQHVLSRIEHNKQPVFVLNGDTFLQMDYSAMFALHQTNQALLTMALRQVEDCSRYGKVIVENNTVKKFLEKGEQGRGLINAGVYLINPLLFQPYSLPEIFSLEKDFLFPYLSQIQPISFITNDYFIDIGIPEDYALAKRDFSQLF